MKISIFLAALLFSLQSFAVSQITSEPFSYGKMGIPKTVIGTYQRDQITDASEFPYRIIGQLGYGCTATLIGPKHIITAAHCVYDQEKAEWINDLNFAPGKTNDNDLPNGLIKWTKVFVQQEYLNTGDTDYDFAVIELDQNIGDDIGWSGYRVLPADEFKNKINITGYPGDKEHGTMWTVGCPGEASGKGIIHFCDTYGGMSGSGIYVQNNNESMTAIHTFGTEKYNGGVVIDQQNFDLIRAWKNSTEYSSNTVIHNRPAEAPARQYDRLKFKNDCYISMRMYLSYRNLDNVWISDGPWTIEPGQTIYVADTTNRIFYFSGLTNKAEFVWKGDDEIHMDNGNTFLMIKGNITTDSWGDWTQSFSCR